MQWMGIVVIRVAKSDSTSVLSNWMKAVFEGEKAVLGEKLRAHFWKRENVMEVVAY